MPEKRTNKPREESITGVPKEQPNTEDSNRTLSLKNLRKTNSLRNV